MSFSKTGTHWFWVNYTFLLIVIIGYYWLVQVAYFYQPISRLPIHVLQSGLLFILGTLLPLLKEDELEPADTKSSEHEYKRIIRQFVFYRLRPALHHVCGIVIPLILAVILFLLFYDFRHIRITIRPLVSGSNEISVQVFVSSGEAGNTLDITQQVLSGHWVQPLRKERKELPRLILHDEYAFFEESVLLSEVFSVSDYLFARETDVGVALNLRNVIDPIEVLIYYADPFSDGMVSISGQLNPTSLSWGNFKPPGGKSISEFFYELSDNFRTEIGQKKPSGGSVELQFPREKKLGYFTCLFNIDLRTLTLTDNRLPDATGLSKMDRKNLVLWAQDIANNDNTNSYENFRQLFFRLKPTTRNLMLREIIQVLDVSPGWRFPLSSKQLSGFGRLLYVISDDPGWIEPDNILILSKKSQVFLNKDAGPKNVENPVRALIKLASTPGGSILQKGLFHTLRGLIEEWPNVNDVRRALLETLFSVSETVPSRESMDEFIDCMREVGRYGSADVRGSIKELLIELEPKWRNHELFNRYYGAVIDENQWI